jgi:hypothetical protein
MKRRLIVNGKFQFSHIFNILFLMAAGTCILTLIAIWIITCLDNRLEINPVNEGLYAVIGAATVIIGASIVWSLYYTRSIAGQMKKISVLLENAAKDDLPEKGTIRFRDNDSFKWIAPGLEACFDNLRTKKDIIRNYEQMKTVYENKS